MSNFDLDHLTWHPTLFPAKNSTNSAKKNRIFPGKGRAYRALILTYLDSPMTEVFPLNNIFFFDFGHLQEETGVQSWTKSENFGSAPSSFFNVPFFAGVIPYLGEERPKNLPNRTISWILNWFAKLWKFLENWQSQKLCWWNLELST